MRDDRAFLANLAPDLRDRILIGSHAWTAAAGDAIFPPRAEWARVGVIDRGIARAHVGAGDGRNLTVRYIRPGELIGHVLPVAGDRAPLGIGAVTDCDVIEFDLRQVRATVETDVAAANRVLAALSHRLEDSYATLAATAFGTMRERVAGHLLDLAQGADESGRLVAHVTQQELADSIGTVREVVARVLRELRDERLVETGAGVIALVDPTALAAQVGRWHLRGRREQVRE